MTFDQVVVQHRSQKNKWHQLIVSLVLPSEPHTAKVFINVTACFVTITTYYLRG